MSVTREMATFAGGLHGVRLANGVIEVGVAASVGPRIMQCGFAGGPNLLGELPEVEQPVAGEMWRIYGGHRLWHAPEAIPRTYTLDSAPVTLEDVPGGIRASASADHAAHIAKMVEVRLQEDASVVFVRHVLRNDGLWPVVLAPWALTVMAPGGTAVAPLPPAGSHEEYLQPTGGVTLWAYTDLTDHRWEVGSRLVLLYHDPGQASPQKIGLFAPDGWLAYAVHGQLFVKHFAVDPAANYPDRGSVAELFANDRFVELESLGPLARLAPGETAVHDEMWRLYRDVPQPASEADALRDVWPLATGERPEPDG